MPRITREEKARNRQNIVEAAGRLFRAQGIDAVGIADLMKEAGLTHGGFYNHFKRRILYTEFTPGLHDFFGFDTGDDDRDYISLDRANRKFRERFEAIEALCAKRGIDVASAGLEVLDGLWNEVKAKRGEADA